MTTDAQGRTSMTSEHGGFAPRLPRRPVYVPGPELNALLAVARASYGAGTDPEALDRAFARVADWNRLLYLAAHHGLIVMLRARLSEAQALGGRTRVPDEAFRRLRGMAQGNLLHSLHYSSVLVTVLDAFASAGVPVMPQRGPVLAQHVYGDAGMRQYTDIDILVPKTEVARSLDVLADMGFERRSPEQPADPALRLRVRCEENLHRSATGDTLDLHWETAIDPLACIPSARRLWASAEPVTFHGRSILQPAPVDTLLGLCVHGAKHGWVKMEGLVTLTRFLVLHPGLSTGAILAAAEQAGCPRRSLLALELAGNVLHLGLRPGVSESVRRDRHLAAIVDRMHASLLMAPHRHPTAFATLRRDMASLDRVRDAAVYGLRDALRPSPTDRDVFSLPPCLEPAYSVLRPLRLAATPLARLRKDP